MKRTLLFILLASFVSHGQKQISCQEANSYLVMAYSFVKDSYESNNLDHLKYYSNRALESYKSSKKTLTLCDCALAMALVNKNIDLLIKTETQETFEDARFFIKQSKENGSECLTEIDKCEMGYTVKEQVKPVVKTIEKPTTESNTLNDLEKEQLALKAQQDALLKQQEALKNKLELQKQKELGLKKEIAINNYNKAVENNIKAFNESLTNFGCDQKLIVAPIAPKDLETKSLEDIKAYYISTTNTLTETYLSQLKSCN